MYTGDNKNPIKEGGAQMFTYKFANPQDIELIIKLVETKVINSFLINYKMYTNL